MRCITKRLLALVLSLAMIVSTPASVFAVREPGGGGAMGFFDGLDAFGNATATIGCVLNVGSVLANADWSDPGGVCLDLVDTIFGTSFGGDPMQETLDAIYSDVSEIKETTNQIKQSVDYLVENSKYVNRQLSMINGSLRTVNSQLMVQTHMLSDITRSLKDMNSEMTASFNQLTELINDQTDTMKSVVYSSTAEIKKTTKLNNALQSYVDMYSPLYTLDNNVLEALSAMQDSYTAFYNAISALSNGDEIMEVLGKITLQADSVSSLTQREQDLVKNTYVKVGGRDQQVLKFHQDFVSDLMKYITNTVYQLEGSGKYIGDTVLAMGDYLTASNEAFNSLTGNKGIGEMYYIYLTCDEADSLTVHQKYNAFMQSMVAQYMTTAWLAEMAYGYKMTEEANGNNNATTIRRYEQYLNNIHAQMVKVNAYFDYEYQKCINDYDYGGEAHGHDQEVILYGNTGSDGVWDVVKKNTIHVPSGMSEASIEIALGEQFNLHYYYRYADVTSREDIVWTSSNPTVAAVDRRGEVLGLSRGVTTIKAEYMGTSAECLVSIGDVMAIANSDGVSRYHYPKYVSEQGAWDQKDLVFTVETDNAYDYYYGITTYLADTVELSEDVRSASIKETTGLTSENLDQFTWFTTGDGAAQLNGHEVSAVTGGWTEVIGYKEVSANHTYDFIGIPVHSTMETLFTDDSQNYSGYTKISSKQDLINLSKNPDAWTPDKKYVLTRDINLGGMEWEPIGYGVEFGEHAELYGCIGTTLGAGSGVMSYSPWNITKPFMGTFDGNGHTISNFKITKVPHISDIQAEYKTTFTDNPNKKLVDSAKKLCLLDVGLFGLTLNADIRDLNVTDCEIDIDIASGDSTGLTFDSDSVTYDDTMTLYAGSLAGAVYRDAWQITFGELREKYELDNPTEAQLEQMYQELNIPARFKEYYEYFKNYPKEGSDSTAEQRFASIMFAYALSTDIKEAKRTSLSGCYATGNLNITNRNSAGMVYAGMVAGGAAMNLNDCTAIGKIEASGSGGAIGGLVGEQYAVANAEISGCIGDAKVASYGGTSAGGLVGQLTGYNCANQNMVDFKESDSALVTEEKAEGIGALILIAAFLKLNFDSIDSKDPNIKMCNNQVYGGVRSDGGYAGGLVGVKKTMANAGMMVLDGEMTSVDNITDASSYYNTDMIQNYVACDVRTTGSYAGGLIGYSDLHKPEEETAKDYVYGQVAENYYTGIVDAGSGGTAGGLIGGVAYDYMVLQNDVCAATSVKGSIKARAVNGRENGVTIKDVICYNGSGGANDTSTAVSEAAMNDPATYTNLWGGSSFLDLSGGLKSDLTTGLDLLGGLVPVPLASRFRFQTETVPTNYHQGDTFKPVTGIYFYTGTGTELITSGVKSSTPDMSKVGKQTVTLSYEGFKDSYDVYIYPTAGYLKVKGVPAVSKDGKSITSGTVTVFENGRTGVDKDISACTVSRNDSGTFIIKYGKYTTAVLPITVNVYANSFTSPLAEYIGTEYYTEGAAADVSALVPASRTFDGKTYNLGGTSDSVKFTASNDVCILSFYGYDPNGSGPSTVPEAKEELEKTLNDAKKIDQGNYTDETFKALQDAIAEAEALAKDPNATADQLNAARNKITAAKNSLKTKDGTDPTPPEPVVPVGTVVKYSSNTYKVTSAEPKTVEFTKAKNSKTITVPSSIKIEGETYTVTSVGAKAFKAKKIRSVYIGKNVKKIAKYAFSGSKATTVTIKTKLLSKARVKGCLKSSKVKTVKVKVGTKKTNKKYLKKYKSYFTKKNAGRKVKIK